MKTIRMTRAQHEAWDKGLRSGEYEQGVGALCLTYPKDSPDGVLVQGEKFCCLGVLQKCLTGEVQKTETLPSFGWLERHGIQFLGVDGIGGYCTKQSPFIPEKQMGLASVNDQGPDDFCQIADLIAANVEYTD